jgi:hypothetical protein
MVFFCCLNIFALAIFYHYATLRGQMASALPVRGINKEKLRQAIA